MRKRITKNEQRKTLMQKRITKNEQRKTFMWFHMMKNTQRKTLMRKHITKNTQQKTLIQNPPTKNIQQKTLTPIRMSFILGKTNPMKNAGHIHRRTYAAPGITTDDSSLKTTVYSSGRVISGPLP
jgi:hypothetical protein